MDVLFHHLARPEFNALTPAERSAMRHALDLLAAFGDQLGAPHTSLVQGADRLRELRPRGGRSPWRAFYRRIGAAMRVGAIGPEALADPPGFRRAVRLAVERLNRIEEGLDR